MTFQFKKVILRKPNNSIVNALSSKSIKPIFNEIVKEHNLYLNTLKNLELEVHILDKLEEYPDSIFVEDPALIYKSSCIILNPSSPSRNGESKIINKEIKKFFEHLLFIKEGTVEGGDVLNINDHFIIGLSNRTNLLGAQNLSNLLISIGATVKICETPRDVLHFKSECSLLDDNLILVSKRMSKIDYLKTNYQLIELPNGEEGAANSLRINNKLLIPDGFPKSEEILSKKFEIIKIKVDEISKLDAGLSCMSLRW